MYSELESFILKPYDAALEIGSVSPGAGQGSHCWHMPHVGTQARAEMHAHTKAEWQLLQ